MNSLWVLVFWVIIVIVGYWGYARWASRRVYEADPKKATPAKMYMDGVDFMPANKNVLFGFQVNSIAGAAPIIGPIVALQWGWLPAMLWLGLGVLFIGWLHDYSSAMVSIRHEGETLGAISYKLISPRARGILLAFIYFYLLLVAGAFLHIITSGLVGDPTVPFPMLVVVGIAFLVGYMIYRAKVNIIATTILAIVVIFAAIGVGNYLQIKASYTVMLTCICIFAYFSAVLPVWMFIQPYNYASVYVVYFGIICGVIGILVGAKPLTLPAFTGWSIPLGPLWPLLFVTIACGSISGWHSLVNSTATSRQIEAETDVRPVSAGAMFTEFTIGIIALIVCATAFADSAGYLQALGKGPVGIFKVSLGAAIGVLGIPASYAKSISSCMILILALTVINLVFRFMKVATIELLGDKIGIAKNHHVATIAALIIAFVLVKTGSWLFIWVLFGGANQLMAGLALLLVTLYLLTKGKNYKIAIYPMFFMYVTTVAALFYMVFWKFFPTIGKVSGGKAVGYVFSAGLGIVLIILAVILAWDGYKAFQKFKAEYGKAPAEAAEAEV
jgi:carbon starvation protein